MELVTVDRAGHKGSSRKKLWHLQSMLARAWVLLARTQRGQEKENIETVSVWRSFSSSQLFQIRVQDSEQNQWEPRSTRWGLVVG
jgi:hypothetical protein